MWVISSRRDWLTPGGGQNLYLPDKILLLGKNSKGTLTSLLRDLLSGIRVRNGS